MPRKLPDTIFEHSSFPLHSIWLKTGKQFYRSEKGVVAYENSKRAHVVAGDPLCKVQDERVKQSLFDEFVDWSHAQGKMVCGYYFSEKFAANTKNFSKYKVGVSRFLDLQTYKESGFKSRDIRRALNHGLKSSLEFIEVVHSKKKDWIEQLKQLEQKWIKTKRGPRIFFLLDEISNDFPGAEKERWFLVKTDNQIHAFLSILPYNALQGNAYYVDHLIQFEQKQRWALDYLIARMLRLLKEENVQELAMGLAAFQKIEGHSPLNIAFKINQKLEPLYKTNGLYAYKKKFTGREENRYLLLDNSCLNLRQIMALISATYQA